MNINTIIGCNECLIIIDLEDGKEVKKIESNSNVLGVKKMKDDELGECLICSEGNNTITIFKKYEEKSMDAEDEDEIVLDMF